MKIIEKAKNVRDQISLVKVNAKKLDDQVWTIAVSCLYHADKHGDVTLMQELVDAMGRSQRRNAVIAWASAYGKFKANAKGKNVDYCRENPTDLEGAMNESPWDFKPEAAFKAWDIEAELKRILKKAERAAQDSRNNVPVDLVRDLGRLMHNDVEVRTIIETIERIPHGEDEAA